MLIKNIDVMMGWREEGNSASETADMNRCRPLRAAAAKGIRRQRSGRER